MRKLIISTLDFVAYLALILLTISGLLAGFAVTASPYAPALQRTLAPLLGGVGGFVAGVLVAGGILVVTEIARNTRRTVELLERGATR
jgi:hypothetical protein